MFKRWWPWRSSQNVALQNAAADDLCVVHIRPNLTLDPGDKEPFPTRGFYSKSNRTLTVVQRTERGCCELRTAILPESCVFIENGELPECQSSNVSLIAATDVSSAEQLLLALWGLGTVVSKLRKPFCSLDEKDEGLQQGAHLCVAKLQELMNGLQEWRHAEIRKILQGVVDNDSCQQGQWIAIGQDRKESIGFGSAWRCGKHALVLFSHGSQAGVFSFRSWHWADRLGLMEKMVAVEPGKRQQSLSLTSWQVLQDRGFLMQHVEENHLQKIDLFVAELLFRKLCHSENLIYHLVCPPMEYLLAPQASISGEAVWASAIMAERAWGAQYPKTYACDRARLIANNDELRKNFKEMEMEHERITNDNNEMRKHLSLLQQRQNISGGGDFPLEYQAISKNLNPAVDCLSDLIVESFPSIIDEFDEQSCLQELSIEVASMLNVIERHIRGHYCNLLGKMLESLGGSETPEAVSKATTLFLDGYCQRHWEHLFIREGLNNKNDENLVVRIFHSHYGSCDVNNSLMLRMAGMRMKKSGQSGEPANCIESRLWDIFRLFWRASVAMFLQRPKLRFAFHVEGRMPPYEDYSRKQHKLLDDICNPGAPVLIIIPAVYRDSDTATETSNGFLSPARVLPVVKQGQKKKWPLVASDNPSKSAARQTEQAPMQTQCATAGSTVDSTNEGGGSQQHHPRSPGASQDNATKEHVSQFSSLEAVRTDDGRNGGTGKSMGSRFR